MTDYEFIAFLDGAYPRVPHTHNRKSNFIDLPGAIYDDAVAQRAIEDQLETGELAEKLGFDGVLMSEQHNGPIGLFGNPMLAAAWLSARTSRMKVIVNGAILNAYRTPIRMAEEIAALDIMTKGRLTVGLPMGHGMQHHSMAVINPAEARERFREAHALMVRALTEVGPFEWRGQYFHVPYVNLWPRPVQKPMPEVWVPGGGSLETLELVAKHRYTYQGVLSTPEVLKKNFDRLREVCAKEGYEASPRQFAIVVSVHVAETDAQARLEAEAHDVWTYQNFYKSPSHDNFPPGYISAASLRGALGGGYRSKAMHELTFDDLVANKWLIAGSPATVTDQLREALEFFGAGRVVLDFNYGTKARWLAQKSMWLFAEQVLPKFRVSGSPSWKQKALPGYETASEYGARIASIDAPHPTVQLDGKFYDVSTAHVGDLRIPVPTPTD